MPAALFADAGATLSDLGVLGEGDFCVGGGWGEGLSKFDDVVQFVITNRAKGQRPFLWIVDVMLALLLMCGR